MLAASFKRTKIIATIGPASREYEQLRGIIEAGANGLRLNFSHGTHEEHGEVIRLARRISQELEKPVSIIGDLQGPKLRVGSLPAEGVPLVRGQKVRFAFGGDYESESTIPTQHDLRHLVKAGDRIFLRDGQITAQVEGLRSGVIVAEVTSPGILLSNQGINLPEADFGGDILTDKDLADIRFLAESDVDYVALSFVQTADDIKELKARLKRLKSDAAVIAKIETRAAADNLAAIVEAADAVMVARGDLATETAPDEVPVLQRQIASLGRRSQTPIIVATQMLESMTNSPQPTRAEVSDVATAVMEGVDSVMLSGETAVGRYPVDTVRLMKKVIRTTEDSVVPERRVDFGDPSTRQNAISAAAIILARQIGAKVIIAETTSGQTARNLSSYRPAVPIIMVTDRRRVYQQLAIVWGGKSFLVDNMKNARERVIARLRAAGNIVPRDAIVTASGHQPGLVGGTDTVQVQMIE